MKLKIILNAEVKKKCNLGRKVLSQGFPTFNIKITFFYFII